MSTQTQSSNSRSHYQLESWGDALPELLVGVFLVALLALYQAQAPPEGKLLPNQTLGAEPPAISERPASLAVFDLPVAKLDWNRSIVYPYSGNVILLVPDRKITETPTPSDEVRFGNVMLVEVVDLNGVPLKPPYTNAAIIRIAISRGSNDESTIRFASRLTNASRIVLLPRP